MTTRFARLKKSAGLALMVGALSAAGVGLSSGTAQASPMMNPDPHHQLIHIITKIQDRFVDRLNRDFMHANDQFNRTCTRVDTRIDRHFEGTFTDRVVDRACGTM
jgi:hypothetical protein